MSPLSPTSRAEVLKLSWLFVPFFFVPSILFILFYWRVYFSADAHIQAAVVAAVCCLPITLLVFRRSRKLVAPGIHPNFGNRTRIGWYRYFCGGFVVFMSLYGWTLTAFVLALPLPGNRITEQSYLVLDAKTCRGRCLGCSYRVELLEWQGFSSSFCAEDLQPLPQVRERLTMRAYFSPRATYVMSLFRTGARPEHRDK